MSVSQLIGRGIGFSPGSVKYVPTHGLTVGAAVFVPVATVCTTGSYVTALQTTGAYVTAFQTTGGYVTTFDTTGSFPTCE